MPVLGCRNVGASLTIGLFGEVRGVVLAPHFEPHERASDWNDVAAHRGRRTAASEIEAGLAELGVQVPKLG